MDNNAISPLSYVILFSSTIDVQLCFTSDVRCPKRTVERYPGIRMGTNRYHKCEIKWERNVRLCKHMILGKALSRQRKYMYGMILLPELVFLGI